MTRTVPLCGISASIHSNRDVVSSDSDSDSSSTTSTVVVELVVEFVEELNEEFDEEEEELEAVSRSSSWEHSPA